MLKNLCGSGMSVLTRAGRIGLKQKAHFSVMPRRFNSNFDQLSNLIKQSTLSKTDKPEVSETNTLNVNDLLANQSTGNVPTPNYFSSRTKDYSFTSTVKHPRDVAKGIRMNGPIAGRNVEVTYNNLGYAISGLRRVLSSNRIKYFKITQARYIRPAKYRKQRKREWWRKRFALGFRDLMSQVQDAKRRGY